MAEMIAKSGFYSGKFYKAGQKLPEAVAEQETSKVVEVVDLDAMTKDELIAEADKRGVSVKSSDPKAEILAALKAAEAEAAE